MIYNFGQFRSSQVSEYVKNIKYSENKHYEVFASMPGSEHDNTEFKFYDYVVNTVMTALNDKKQMNSYYLRFKIYKQELSQTFDIRLIQDKENNVNAITQFVDTITVDALPKGVVSDYETYEFIITPSDNHIFTGIHFELHRGISDYQTENEDGSNGRIVQIEIEKIQQVVNILNVIGKNQLKQIGIQSVPGLMLSVNGEGIKVGRSGLYEITNGIQIDFLGFIVENNDKYFILDYQY